MIVSLPHNGERFLNLARKAFPKARIIYDAEATFAKREILRAELEGRDFSEVEKSELFRKELNIMGAADVIVTVSEEERQLIRADAADRGERRLGVGPSRADDLRVAEVAEEG